MLGHVRLTQGYLSSAALTRKADEPTSGAVEQISLFLTLGGHWRGDAGRQSKQIGPGEMVLLDRSKSLVGEVHDLSSVTVVLPRESLRPAVPRLDALHGQTLSGPLSVLLADHVTSVASNVGRLQSGERALVGRVTQDLVVACLAGQTSPETVGSVSAATRHRVLRHIEAQLTDPGLTPDAIARGLGMSRSSVYRAFAAVGGVANAIQNRRLDAVHARLCDPGLVRSLAEIAEAYGFTDYPHFSRAFRRRFDRSPRDVRADTLVRTFSAGD